ncbi:MAG: phosphoribosylanthranilate isomerase [Bacillota bacterium]
MVRVKICGIQSLDEALVAIDCGADALGFVFAPSSRRMNPERAREIIMELPPFVTKVGVFVNEERYIVQEIASFCRLDVLQFHGEEPPSYTRNFSQQMVKAFALKDEKVLEDMEKYQVDAFLVDAFVPGQAGGTGKVANWELAARACRQNKWVILAGGLHPDNVAVAMETVRPFAVDVSSGLETDGRKDPVKIKEFMDEVRRVSSEFSR